MGLFFPPLTLCAGGIILTGETEELGKKLPQFHSIHHTSHMD
jgi:hypothetical protein